MVRTRSAGASEPLERLVTPPKRQRKPKTKKIMKERSKAEEKTTLNTHPERQSMARTRSKSPVPEEHFEPMDIDIEPLRLPHEAADIEKHHALTQLIEETPSRSARPQSTNQELIEYVEPNESPEPHSRPSPTSNKRPLEDSVDDIQSKSKKARRQDGNEGLDLMWPFTTSNMQVNDDELDVPGQTYAETILKDRRRRELAQKQNGRLGVSPRRPPKNNKFKYSMENPFGIETLSAQEKAEFTRRQQGHVDQDTTEEAQSSSDNVAPPTTPRRGLFGSLKELGSAALSRFSSPFNSLQTPSSAPGKRDNASKHAQTEPRRKRVPIWDADYTPLRPLVESTPLVKATAPREETESEKKRQAYEAKYGKTNPSFDHLHYIPVDGDMNNLPYPVRKEVVHDLSASDRSEAEIQMSERARRKRLARFGPPKEIVPAANAPLFGPDSHYNRGTINPRSLKNLPADHPAWKAVRGQKRSLDDAQNTVSAKESTNSQQPSVENVEEVDESGPSTPPAKKQKTAATQTPRSALKAPGTIGRGGRSARFNPDPVASVKQISPISGFVRAGTLSPGNPFLPADIDNSHMSDDTLLSDPSPRTMTNTFSNTGIRYRPGDALPEEFPAEVSAESTDDVSDDVISPEERQPLPPDVRVEWFDERHPEWKPSTFNPNPSTFRFAYEEEELPECPPEELASKAAAEAASPPSTPRMAHAELPKNSSSSSQVAQQSASALEAANLERRRAEASKTKPRTASRLAEVTSARSRSPSPPALDSDDIPDPTDGSAKTPSPTLTDSKNAVTWSLSEDKYEYFSTCKGYPDFTYNRQKELVPCFSLKTSTGAFDDKIVGPDNMTEKRRQAYYNELYNKAWAENEFGFDPPQTYEDAGLTTSYIQKLIRKTDAACPEMVRKCDERFAEEWDAHQAAIDNATSQGKILIATFPDRDGTEPLDLDLDDEEEL